MYLLGGALCLESNSSCPYSEVSICSILVAGAALIPSLIIYLRRRRLANQSTNQRNRRTRRHLSACSERFCPPPPLITPATIKSFLPRASLAALPRLMLRRRRRQVRLRNRVSPTTRLNISLYLKGLYIDFPISPSLNLTLCPTSLYNPIASRSILQHCRNF